MGIFTDRFKSNEPFETTTVITILKNNSEETNFLEKTAAQKKLSEYTNNYYPDANTVALFEMINNYRIANGLNKLVLDEDLSRLAYVRACEQECKGHIRPDGTRFFTIFGEYDVYYKTVGENIAISSTNDIERIFNGWKDSESHNANMLENWKYTGICIIKIPETERYCALQLFAC